MDYSIDFHSLDFLSLGLLCCIAESGSISEASRTLGISQPSATGRLARLERRLGVDLVERSHAGTNLTEDGEVVHACAIQVLGAAIELDAVASSISDRRNSQVSIAASCMVGEYLMNDWLAVAGLVGKPHSHVALQVAKSSRVVDLVKSGGAEVGFIEAPVDDLDGMDSRVVGQNKLVLVVSPSHPLATVGSISLAELSSHQLVMREVGSGIRSHIDTQFSCLGLKPPVPLLEIDSNPSIKRSVQHGTGPAIVSGIEVAQEIADRSLVVVDFVDADLSCDIRAVWRTHKLASVASRIIEVAAASSVMPVTTNAMSNYDTIGVSRGITGASDLSGAVQGPVHSNHLGRR